ncbi:MAG: ChbG/HpnK family deacetylase [Synergistaceae bacterium]|jgi:predicted glycoside hydrolase/deacetylase ChbG (UPF0249 family)|nr:ChbG/HpnK family deacetylase [Synergistaceae bacterium]
MEKIINADDFGMSDDINRAIERAFERGCVTSASLATNGARAGDALKFARDNPSLRIGVHLTLTEGPPLSDPASLPLLVGADGRLAHGFARLLWLSFTRESDLLEQAELEWRKQIDAALEYGIVISHLDSHRHVHMIPALFRLAVRLRREYGVPRLRIVNEDFLNSLFTARSPAPFFDGALVKYAVLKTFYHWNRTGSDTYFYGISYTGKIWGSRARVSVPRRYDAVEVALHPRAVTDGAASDFATAADADFPGRISRKSH